MSWSRVAAVLLGSGGLLLASKVLRKTRGQRRITGENSAEAENPVSEQPEIAPHSLADKQVPPAELANQGMIGDTRSPTTTGESEGRNRQNRTASRERRSAEQRGGRPLGTKNRDRGERSRAFRREVIEKPALVCRLTGRWVVGVEVPDELCEEEPKVQQGSTDLEDPRRLGWWLLLDPLGAVNVKTTDGTVYPIEAAPYRCFKLSRNQEHGRLVKNPTAGNILVVAPADWRLEGHRLCSPPQTVLGGTCRAYPCFLSPNEAEAVRFRTPEGSCVEVYSRGALFDLEGHRVDDAHADAGPFFGPEPPHLECLPGATYCKVVAGEAGEVQSRKRWAKSAATYEQLLPIIRERGAGWFFLRIYDEKEDLVDTLDFRFATGLDGVEIESVPEAPGPQGHRSARVMFRHQSGLSIRPSTEKVRTKAVPQGSVAYLPAEPEWNATSWIVSAGEARQVELQLRLNRVWWALGETGRRPSPGQWTDRPVPPIPAQDLPAASTRLLRLRGVRGARELTLGFDFERRRPLHIGGEQDEVDFRLSDLVEAEELKQPGAWPLKLWIKPSDGGGLQSCVVAEVTVSKQALGTPGWRHAKPHHLMRQLHAVRRSARRPLRVLVGEFRKRHYRHGGRLKSKSSNKNFFADGLCLLALALDRSEALVWEPSIKEHWRRSADEARTQDPLIFHAWEERYQGLQPPRRAAQLALTKAAEI